jgi:hypothetical protein
MKQLSLSVIILAMVATFADAQVQKRILLEEFSTAPCGFCPDGDIVASQLVKKYPQIIWMTHHAGFGTDSMTVIESKTIANAFTNFAPGAAIDRGDYPIPVYTNNPPYIAVSRQKWDSVCTAHLNDTAFVALQLSNTFNPAARTFTCTVTGRFSDTPLPGDLRLNLFLVEDSIVGSGKGFDQTNYFNSTPGHPCYQKGDPIVGYVHHRVLRAVPSGTWGLSGIVPSAPTRGTSFTYSFSNIAIPAHWKAADLDVIAFVSYYNSEAKLRKVLNSESKLFLDGVQSSDSEIPSASTGLTLYPNPVQDRLTVRAEGWGTLFVCDRIGRVVLRTTLERGGNTISVAQLPEGMYFYQYLSGRTVRQGKFTRMPFIGSR